MWIFIICAFFISFITTLSILPYVKKWIENKKRLKADRNKFKKPRLKSLEGIFCVIILITTLSLILGLQTLLDIKKLNVTYIIAGLLSIVIIALINFIDDIIKIPNRAIKLFLIMSAIIPAMAINFGHEFIDIPFCGPRNISLLYPLVVVPFIMLISIISTNSTRKINKPALNNYIIISLTLGVCAWLKGTYTAMIIFSCLLGLFLVLKSYYDIENKEISLGKAGRSSFGAIFAVGAIIGNIKAPLLILIIPYFANFLIMEFNKIMNSDFNEEINTIKVLNKKLTIKKLLKYIFFAEVICSIIAISYQIYRVNPTFVFQVVSY